MIFLKTVVPIAIDASTLDLSAFKGMVGIVPSPTPCAQGVLKGKE